MKVAESWRAIWVRLRERPADRFFDPASRRSLRSLPLWPGDEHRHARGEELDGLVVPCPVLRWALSDDLGEAGAERAERGAPDGQAALCDRHAPTEVRLGPL